MTEVIRLKDVAEMIGVSETTIRRWLDKGQGPPCKITPTGVYLFERALVDQWWADLPGAPKAVSTEGRL